MAAIPRDRMARRRRQRPGKRTGEKKSETKKLKSWKLHVNRILVFFAYFFRKRVFLCPWEGPMGNPQEKTNAQVAYYFRITSDGRIGNGADRSTAETG